MTGRFVGDRRAEVAGEDLAEVLEVLHDERPVVAGLVDALCELVGAEPAAQRGGDRVAGRAHEEEDEGDEDEDGREDQEEADQQVAAERLRRDDFGFGRPAMPGRSSVAGTVSSVLMDDPRGYRGTGATRGSRSPPSSSFNDSSPSSALRERAVAELERRVERVLRALDVGADDRDLRALQVAGPWTGRPRPCPGSRSMSAVACRRVRS